MLIARKVLNVTHQIALVLLALCGVGAAQKLAITFDDLPLNGELPPGVTRTETARNVLAILKAACASGVWIRECEEARRES
jgi:hypothetical protein